MSDQLTEISRKDLHLLKTLYTPDGVKNYLTYTTIDNYIRCFETDPNVKHIKCFCLNGDFSRGTFFLIDRDTAYTDSFDVSTGELRRLLLLIDFSKGYFFMSLGDGPASVVRDIIKLRNIDMSLERRCPVYCLPKECALNLNLEIPDEIELKSITELSDLERTFSVWPFRTWDSFPLMERASKYNPSVGAFLKNEGTLVAWVFRFMSCPMMALQTDEKFTGRGYGSLIVKAQSKKIAELGHDAYAGIFDDNLASRSLFGKIGFKPVDYINWMCTKHNWSASDE